MQAPFRFPLVKLAYSAIALLGGSLICASPVHAANNPPGSQLITYFNFNDQNLTSDAPGSRGAADTASFSKFVGTFVGSSSAGNIATGDPTAAGAANNYYLHLDGSANGNKTFSFTTSTTGLSDIALSFAIRGSGFTDFTLTYISTGGSGTIASTVAITSTFATQYFDLKNVANIDNQSSITFTLTFNPTNPSGSPYVDFDNIQVTKKPEPATTAAGVLAVVGLCWHQRRRLSSVRKLFGLARSGTA